MRGGAVMTATRRAAGAASRTKLDEHNPELAERLWSEHREPYTEQQYQTLINALTDEVRSAEGGAA